MKLPRKTTRRTGKTSIRRPSVNFTKAWLRSVKLQGLVLLASGSEDGVCFSVDADFLSEQGTPGDEGIQCHVGVSNLSMSNECGDGCGTTLSFTINYSAWIAGDEGNGASGSVDADAYLDSLGNLYIDVLGPGFNFGNTAYASVSAEANPSSFSNCIGIVVYGIDLLDNTENYIGVLIPVEPCSS